MLKSIQIYSAKHSDYLLDLAIFGSLFLLYFHKAIFFGGLVTVGMDLPVLVQPLQEFTKSHILEGVFPFWSPYWFGGFPTFEAPRIGLYYPATLLYLLFDFPFALKFDVLLHSFYVGVCAYLLGRDYGLLRPIAIAFAVLVLSGPFGLYISVYGQPFAFHVLAHFPLAFLFLRRALRGKSSWYALFFALMLTLQIFAGDLQMFLYGLMVFGLYTVGSTAGLFLRGTCSFRDIVMRNVAIASAVVLGLLMATIQLLPTQQLIDESIRGIPSGTNFVTHLSSTWIFYKKELMGMTMGPLAFGTPFLSGALFPVLLLFAFSGRTGRGRVLELSLMLFLAVFSAMPEFFVDHVLKYISIFYKSRAHMRIAHLAIFLYYILICFGLQRLWQLAKEEGRGWWRWLFLSIVCAAYAWVLIGNGRLGKPVLYLELGVFGFIIATLLFTRSVKGWLPYCLVALLLIESFSYFRTEVHLWDGRLADYEVNRDYREFSEAREDSDRVALFTPSILGTDLPQATGMRTRDRIFGGFHSLFLDNMTKFLDSSADMELVVLSKDGLFEGEDFRKYPSDWITVNSYDALDLLNVRYLVAEGMVLELPEQEAAKGGRFRKSSVGALTVYENLNVYPGAFTVHQVERFDTVDEVLGALSTHQYDLRNTVLLAGDFDHNLIEAEKEPEEVEILHYGINEIEIAVEMKSAGFLVLTDVYYPGWKAYLGASEELEIYAVDSVVRGVILPEGKHRVRFVYRPKIFFQSAALSFTGLIVAIGWALLLYFRREREGRS